MASKADKSAARSGSPKGEKSGPARDTDRGGDRGPSPRSDFVRSQGGTVRSASGAAVLSGSGAANRERDRIVKEIKRAAAKDLFPENDKSTASEIVEGSVQNGKTSAAQNKKRSQKAENSDDLLTDIGETLGAAAIGFALGGPVGAAIGAGVSLLGETFLGGGIDDQIGRLGGPNAERVSIGFQGAIGFAANPIGTIIDTVGAFAGTFEEGQQVSAASRFFSRSALGAMLGGPIGMAIGAGLSLIQDAGIFRGEPK